MLRVHRTECQGLPDLNGRQVRLVGLNERFNGQLGMCCIIGASVLLSPLVVLSCPTTSISHIPAATISTLPMLVLLSLLLKLSSLLVLLY